MPSTGHHHFLLPFLPFTGIACSLPHAARGELLEDAVVRHPPSPGRLGRCYLQRVFSRLIMSLKSTPNGAVRSNTLLPPLWRRRRGATQRSTVACDLRRLFPTPFLLLGHPPDALGQGPACAAAVAASMFDRSCDMRSIRRLARVLTRHCD